MDTKALWDAAFDRRIEMRAEDDWEHGWLRALFLGQYAAIPAEHRAYIYAMDRH